MKYDFSKVPDIVDETKGKKVELSDDTIEKLDELVELAKKDNPGRKINRSMALHYILENYLEALENGEVDLKE